MSTTIRISKKTHEILKEVQDEEGFESYEKLIKELLIRSGILINSERILTYQSGKKVIGPLFVVNRMVCLTNLRRDMMDKIVFDSYAWIEYFRGSEEGEKVDEYIKSK